jgi:hypothetical protein
MNYLIGGAARAGKNLLGLHLSAKLRCGWVSTNLLLERLWTKQVEGVMP